MFFTSEMLHLLWEWLLTILCLKYPLIFLWNNYKKKYVKKWIFWIEFLKKTCIVHFHRTTDQNLQETDERPSHNLINTMLRDSHQRCPMKKSFLENFAILTPMLKSLFNKVTVLRACDFIKKRLQHRCFPVIIAKFLRTPIPKNICE